ncbi:unnamed protein product [Allacma fusca]|uniref:Uncharacterized protein n=1 Tax=Allacma fusca TaxID=39272 RepID=A0A8J2K802_9HEXA|nr:unnamed protein product [Allacma fusca]
MVRVINLLKIRFAEAQAKMAPVKKDFEMEASERNQFESWFKLLRKGKADGAKIGKGMVTKLDFVLEDDHCYYVVYSKQTWGQLDDNNNEKTIHK